MLGPQDLLERLQLGEPSVWRAQTASSEEPSVDETHRARRTAKD